MPLDEAGLQAEIGITLNKLTKQLATAEARMNKTAKKMETDFRRVNTRVDRSFKTVNSSSNAFARGGLRNVSLQLNQVAQSGAVTGDWVKALAIQLPDMAIGFGTVGIAAGALAGLLLPIVSDLALFSDEGKSAEEQAKKFAEALDEIASVRQRAFASVQLASVDGLDDLEKEFDEVSQRVQKLAAAQAETEIFEVQSKVSDLLKTVFDADFGKDISENVSGVAAAVIETTADDIKAMEAEIATLEQTIANAAIPNADQVSLLKELREELAAANLEFDKAGNVAEGFSVDPESVENIREITRLLPEAVAAADFASASDMISEMRDLMQEFGAETRQGLGKELTEIEGELRRIERLLRAAEKAGLDVSTAASGIAPEVSAAADEAARLADELNEANNNAASLEAPRLEQRGRGGDPRQFEDDPYWNDRYFPDPDNPRKSRTRRGGGRSRTSFDPFAAGAAQIASLQNQLSTIGKTTGAVAELNAKFQLLNAAKRRGIDLDKVNSETGKTVRQEIEEQAVSIGRLTAKYEQAQQAQQFFNQQQIALEDGFINAIVEGENFIGVLANVAKELARAALQAALFGRGPMAGLFGQTPGTGLLTGLFGGVFGGRAGGGGVQAGVPVQVNERTPNSEIFVPGQNGAILNVAQAQQALRGAAARHQSPNITVPPAQTTVVVIDDPNKIAEFMASHQGEQIVVEHVTRMEG